MKAKLNLGRYRLLSVDSNPKVQKGDGRKTGWVTAVLHLSPSTRSMDYGGAGINMCPWSDGCERSCLNTAGRGGIPGWGETIQDARKLKTWWFVRDRAGFMRQLIEDIAKFEKKVRALGLRPAIRLNGTSDILWDRVQLWNTVRAHRLDNIMALFPKIQFYDYTKRPLDLALKLPKNYHLTFSRGMAMTHATVRDIIDKGFNVAIVYNTPKGGALPTKWGQWMEKPTRVVDGDKNDLRFLDPKGVIVGLRAKGKAKHEDNGFVVKVQHGLALQ